MTLAGVERAEALIMTHGAEVPNSVGQCGGFPSSTVLQMWGEQAAKEGVQVEGAQWITFGPKPGLRPMRPGDVYRARAQAGGGWGDPLDRDPQAVLADLESHAISAEAAREIYGVVVRDGALDGAATAARRGEIRKARVGGELKPANVLSSAKQIGGMGTSLRLVRSGSETQVVSRGGYVLSRGSTRWRSGAVRAPMIPHPCLGIRLHEGLAMTAYYCPASGELLAVDVHEAGREPADDILIDLQVQQANRPERALAPADAAMR